MKKISIRAMLMCALAITTLAAGADAYAEGSKDLIGNIPPSGLADAKGKTVNSYRPFLEWQVAKQMELPRRNVIYVYAEKGDKIEFGSSVPFSYSGSVDLINENATQKLSDQIRNNKNNYGTSDTTFPTIAVTLPVEKGGNPFDPTTANDLTAQPGSELTNDPTGAALYVGDTYTPGHKIYFFGHTNQQDGVSGVSQENRQLTYYRADDNGNYIYDNTAGSVPYREITGEDDSNVQKYTKETITGDNSPANGHYHQKDGYIANLSQEKQENNSGYTPLSFIAPVDGTYAFRFLSINGGGNAVQNRCDEDFGNMVDYIFYDDNGNGYNHYKNPQQTGTVAAWDITVKSPQEQSTGENTEVNNDENTGDSTEGNTGDSTEPIYVTQTGRVWTDRVFLNMGGNRASGDKTGDAGVALFSNLYVLTHDSFEYKIDFNGIDPFGFAFYSNKRGLLLDQYSLRSDPDMKSTTDYDAKSSDGSDSVYFTYHADNPNEYVRPLLHSFYSRSASGNDVGNPPVRIETDAFGNYLKATINGEEKTLKSTVLANIEPVVSGVDVTHKIFFEQPDPDVIQIYNGKGLVNDVDDLVTPTIKEFSYTGKGSAADNTSATHYGTLGIGGEFKVTIPKKAANNTGAETDTSDANTQKVALEDADVKTLSIKLDFSNYKLDSSGKPVLKDNKEWETASATEEGADKRQNNIVILKTELMDETGNALGVVDGDNYVYTLIWDGKDAYGNDVPRGTYTQNIVSASWEAGRAHFPLLDVEGNPYGIKISRENLPDDSDNPRYNVFYNNDAKYANDSTTAWYFKDEYGDEINPNQKIGDCANMTAGIDSTNGVMSYGTNVNGNRNEDGNFCAIDLWARFTKSAREDFSIGVKAPGDNESTSGVYVSFVAADGKNENREEPFKESHVKYYEKDINGATTERTIRTFEDTHNMGNETVYGNTISTGFIATLQSLDKDISQYRDIKWEITVPVDSYIKVNEGNDFSNTIELSEAKLSDNNNVPNKGDIKQITGIIPPESPVNYGLDDVLTAVSDDGADEGPENYIEDNSEPGLYDTSTAVSDDGADEGPEAISDIAPYDALGDTLGVTIGDNCFNFSFQYHIGTAISGKVSVVTGIVIDNLYAPDATATAKYETNPFNNVDGITGIEAGNLSTYETHNDNEYYQAYHKTPDESVE